MLCGIDISSWQTIGRDQKTVDVGLIDAAPDFVVAKVTQGTGYISPACDAQCRAARAAGKLLGVYHYATGADARAEAEHFVANIRGYLGEALLALDWEANENPVFGRGEAAEGAWCAAFVQRVHDLTQVWPVIYVQGSDDQRVDDLTFHDCGLWLAQYPGTCNTYEQAIAHGIPSIDSKWSAVTLWQFTSALNGRSLDGDLFNGDAAAWRRIAQGDRGGAATPTPAPIPAPPPPPVQAPVPAPTGTVYVVRAGDTLSAIAAAYGTTVAAIVAANPIIKDPNLIEVGWQLTIPTGTPVAPAPVPAAQYLTIPPGATLSRIAMDYHTTVAQLLAWNRSTYPRMTADYIQAGWRIRVA